eukprot:TRINITY_DN10257_c0_g1_i1.p1 TRINITY_DN10257_c0_g1~~TRINITY_DN10257_c0_g1_i1.p1  ORF type:complete len:713 (+),score=102.08 TRINITY_DN10257_c0_g1_i1:102-2240(+)
MASRETFAHLLLRDPQLLLVRSLFSSQVLGNTYLEAERLATPVINVFAYSERIDVLLTEMVTDEFAHQKNVATLFRNNSMTSHLITTYTKLIGRTYLVKVLNPVIRSLLKSLDKNYEVDPNRSKNVLPEAIDNVKELTSNFMSAILRSASSCPAPISFICQTLAKVTEERFPQSRYMAIGGFFFLRYVCPAIVTPDGYKVITAPVPPEARRALVLASKVIQKTVNERDFAENEAYMQPFNTFIQGYQHPIHEFLDQISSSTSSFVNVPIPTITHQLYIQSLQVIRDEIIKRSVKITEFLHSHNMGQSNYIISLLNQISTLPLDWFVLYDSKKTATKVQCMVLVDKLLWCGLGDGTILICDTQDPSTEPKPIQAHEFKKLVTAIICTGKHVWTASEDKAIGVFDVDTLKPVHRLTPHRGIVKTLLHVPINSNEVVWSGDTNGLIIVWHKFEQADSIDLKEPICSMCFVNLSPQEQFVWVGIFNVIFCIDFNTRQVVTNWKSHAGIVCCLLPVRGQVWSCSQDKKICIWDQRSYSLLKVIEAHDGTINCMSLVQVDDKQHIWTTSFETIIIWDSETYQKLRVIHGHVSDISCMISLGNCSACTGSRDQTINFWKYQNFSSKTEEPEQTTSSPVEKEENTPLKSEVETFDPEAERTRAKFVEVKDALINVVEELMLGLRAMGLEIEETLELPRLLSFGKRLLAIKQAVSKPVDNS